MAILYFIDWQVNIKILINFYFDKLLINQIVEYLSMIIMIYKDIR